MSRAITISLSLPSELEQRLLANVADASVLFPNQIRAIQGLALLTQRRWIEYASGMRPLPSGKTINRVTGEYAGSINIEENGVLKYVIFSSDPKAKWIEEGFPAWDMHKLLNTSHKVRLTAKGKRYLIIPFRHKTPGTLGVTMPQEAYNWWLRPERRSSVITGHYVERSIQDGTPVTRNTYLWGDRLTQNDVMGLGLDPANEGRRLVGMVRFQNNEDQGGRHITFRVLSEGSKGWIQPARPGQWPARTTYEFIQTHYQEIMRIALEEDVKLIKENSLM